jgi:hypothetical protein
MGFTTCGALPCQLLLFRMMSLHVRVLCRSDPGGYSSSSRRPAAPMVLVVDLPAAADCKCFGGMGVGWVGC